MFLFCCIPECLLILYVSLMTCVDHLYTGVWLAALDIQRIHDTSFDTEAISRGCLNHHIVSHKQSIQQIRDKHSSLQSTGKLCYTEMRHRDEYAYNWSNPPSRCCIPGVS